jgi:hypothetical protein
MLRKNLPKVLLTLVALSGWIGLPTLAAEGNQLD